MKWGQIIGLIYGTEPDKFDPNGNITREQAFTLVYRLLTLLRKELPEADVAVLDIFPDGGNVSDYAANAIAALFSAGIVNGSGEYLLPQSFITRAELCKVTCIAVLGWTPPTPPEEEPGTTPDESGGTEDGGEEEPGEENPGSEDSGELPDDGNDAESSGSGDEENNPTAPEGASGA